MKTFFNLIVIFLIIIGVIYVAGTFSKKDSGLDYKNISYLIDGKEIKLVNGEAIEDIPNSSAQIITRYFGNDLRTDLDGDGIEDVAFLLTQETGGSGTFFYVVGALNTKDGYVGTDGYFLGDRIAPQNINESQNPRHKNVIVVNYADRERGQAMSEMPSAGKSAYLKLDKENMMWAIVEPDFEGESNL